MTEFLFPLLSSFGLVFVAELGDKTQLVCMTLASRHKPWPVFLGASAAFAVLNVLAVSFGHLLSEWVPEQLLRWTVVGLFVFFGIKALMAASDDDEAGDERSGHSVFITAFMMIFVAELGDKTQLSVAALSTTYAAIAVWVGATLALVASAGLGVVGGRWLAQRVSPVWLHRASGVLFLGFAAFVAVNTVLNSAPPSP